MAQKFSGFNVPQKWGKQANYQGGQGGQLVTHALVTWRALRPKNGVAPGTISGQWEQVPDTITSPVQNIGPDPIPPPKPAPPTPPPNPPLVGMPPISVNNGTINVAVMTPSGTGAGFGVVPQPPTVAGTSLFLREDATWALPGAGAGTVTSVGLALPGEFNVSGSPVIAAGILTGAWANQTANTGFMGPAAGIAATPGFRALVTADLPAGTGTVTSIGLSTDASYLTIGSSPVTTSGVITANKTTGLTANQFVGTPNGAPGTADLRSLVAADLPNTAVTPGAYTYSSITVDAQGRLTSASSGAAPTGTVTSVALSMPSFITVSGSPVTTTGTLTGTLATQSANAFFAGPTSGAAAAPTFRAVVEADLGTGTGDNTKYLRGDMTWQPTVNIVTAGTVGVDFSTTQLLSFPNGDSYDVPGAIGATHSGLTGVAATDIITDTGHGYSNGDRVVFTAITGGATLVIDTQYYIISAAANTYQLSSTVGGAAINFTTNITAGSINSVGSISIAVGASDPRTYAVIASVNYIYNNASIARNLGFGVVLGSNVNAAPGNSGILYPLNYVSNATSVVLGHLDPGNTGSTTTQLFQASIIGRFTLPAGAQTVKLVAAARNVTATATFHQRDLTIMASA